MRDGRALAQVKVGVECLARHLRVGSFAGGGSNGSDGSGINGLAAGARFATVETLASMLAQGASLEYQFDADGEMYCKGEATHQLDREYGDIYSQIKARARDVDHRRACCCCVTVRLCLPPLPAASACRLCLPPLGQRPSPPHANTDITPATLVPSLPPEATQDLECQLVAHLEQKLLEWLPMLRRAQLALAELDALLSLAAAAKEHGLTQPRMVEDGTGLLSLKGAWHPLLPAVSASAAGAFGGQQRPATVVPNDCEIGSAGERLMLLTGPNASGKTVYLRTVALIVYLAQ